MKRISWLTFVWVIPVLMGGYCTQEGDSCVDRGDEVNPNLFKDSVTVNVPLHASVINPGLCAGIYYSSVESDSRCPKDLICIWSGEVTVRLGVVHQGKITGTFALSTWSDSPDPKKTIEINGRKWTVRLLYVSPYPGDPATEDEKYATISVVPEPSR